MAKCGLIVFSFIAALVAIFVAIIHTDTFIQWSIPSCDEKPVTQVTCWRQNAAVCAKLQEENSKGVKIRPFKIDVSKEELASLTAQLNDSIHRKKVQENKNGNPPHLDTPYNTFKDGFSHKYLYETILPYWRDTYRWKTWQDKLNKFEHFKVNINSLDIHFMHVKQKISTNSKQDDSQSTVIPILLLHGWPGSFFEFYKAIPILMEKFASDKTKSFTLELIVASLPGFGFSDAAEISGLGVFETADIMFKLMDILGYTEKGFYVQGGDWGAMIAQIMARYNPTVLRGIHVNFLNAPAYDIRYWTKLAVGAYFPSLVLQPYEITKVYPYGKRMTFLFSEMAYMFMQSTKPTTIGIGLEDSPAGLAGYILEKFSTWTSFSFLQLKDGGFGKLSENGAKFTLDELLTNVMIYWHTKSITSSAMFYKQSSGLFQSKCTSVISHVPVGIASFPNELMSYPLSWARLTWKNIITYNDLPRGGHFAAFEEPELFSHDLYQFIIATEEQRHKTVNKV